MEKNEKGEKGGHCHKNVLILRCLEIVNPRVGCWCATIWVGVLSIKRDELGMRQVGGATCQ